MIDETLTALTDIKMPHYAPLAQASGSIDLNGHFTRVLLQHAGSGQWRGRMASCRRAETAKCRCNGRLQQSLLGHFRLFWFR